MDKNTVTFNDVEYKIERIEALVGQAHLMTLGGLDLIEGLEQAPVSNNIEHHLVIHYEGRCIALLRCANPADGDLRVRLASKFFLKKAAAPVFTRHHDSINDQYQEQRPWGHRNERYERRDDAPRNNIDLRQARPRRSDSGGGSR